MLLSFLSKIYEKKDKVVLWVGALMSTPFSQSNMVSYEAIIGIYIRELTSINIVLLWINLL